MIGQAAVTREGSDWRNGWHLVASKCLALHPEHRSRERLNRARSQHIRGTVGLELRRDRLEALTWRSRTLGRSDRSDARNVARAGITSLKQSGTIGSIRSPAEPSPAFEQPRRRAGIDRVGRRCNPLAQRRRHVQHTQSAAALLARTIARIGPVVLEKTSADPVRAVRRARKRGESNARTSGRPKSAGSSGVGDSARLDPSDPGRARRASPRRGHPQPVTTAPRRVPSRARARRSGRPGGRPRRPRAGSRAGRGWRAGRPG